MSETTASRSAQGSPPSSPKPSVVTDPEAANTTDNRPAKPATRKPATRKPATRKPAARSAKAAPVKKAPAKKAPVKKAPAKKAPAKKAPAKKAPAKKAPAKRAPAKRAPAKRSRAKRSAARSRSSSRFRAASGARRATTFKVGDKVVHPYHGAAEIIKRVDQEIDGENRSYFVLQIATEQLTVFAPVDTINENIRPVISKTAAGKVLRTFKEDPQDSGSNWSRWYKVLNEKMTSGDIYQVAEVVRDLTHAQQVKGISPALKRMLSKARVTLISELEFAFAVDTEDATRRLDRMLPEPETPD